MVACFSSANLPNLDNYLLNFDFCHLSCASSGDECWSQLKSAIVNASLLFVPRVRVPCNPLVDTFEHRCSTDVLYLDIRKAFDSVPHQELLFKLWRIGITGKLWFWFKAYISNRLHFVHYKGFSSSALPVLSGVPQGSVLRPLLFLVYINEFQRLLILLGISFCR